MNRSDYYYAFYKWVREKIEDFSINHLDDVRTKTESYILDSLKFITFNFDNNSILIRKNINAETMIGDIQFNQLHHFYNLFCREIFGRDYLKISPAQKPMCFASLDVNGTRYWREMGEFSNIHLHTIWMIDPNDMQHFLSVRDKALQANQFDFKQIHIRNLDNSGDIEENIRNIVMYNLKFDRFNIEEADIENNFRLYPTEDGFGRYKLQNW